MIGDRILRSAMASKLAYDSRSIPIRYRLHGKEAVANSTRLVKNVKTGLTAYMWNNGEKSLLVAFKGTSTVKDLIHISNACPTKFNFCEFHMNIHSGLQDMFQSIESELTTEVMKYKFVTFCGHSFGGALAMFAAAYYGNMTNRNVNISCHSFGAPRVGDKIFNTWLKNGCNDVLNIVNENDVIPRLPIGTTYEEFDNTVVILDGMHDWFHAHDLDTYIENLELLTEIQKLP